MRATVIYGERDIRLEEVPDPVLSSGGDAIVRVVAACVCGSDLWPYRGVTPTEEPHRIGHEFVGIVESVGPDVGRVRPGDFVIAPFYDCDMTCANCLNGVSTSCLDGGWWGADDRHGGFADGAQGELVRVPHADGSLVATPGMPDAALVPSLLTLADVMGTGHHAAVSAGVTAGSTVVVVGDGAVGLCAILAARRLGASRIVAMSRHADRQALATEFGATDIVAERGDAAATVGHQLHQPLGGQHLERLAQWRSADQPGFGQRLFVDELAGRQRAVENHRAQPRGHAVVQRGAAQGGGFNHKLNHKTVITQLQEVERGLNGRPARRATLPRTAVDRSPLPPTPHENLRFSRRRSSPIG